MKKIKKLCLKSRVTVAILIFLPLIFAFSVTNRIFPFWSDYLQSSQYRSMNLILIGNWSTEEIDPPVDPPLEPPLEPEPPVDPPAANFDDAVALLEQNDAHLLHGYRQIHILGSDQTDLAPIIPTSIDTYDVFIFQIGTVITAVQVTGNLDISSISSWEGLQNAIGNIEIALNTGRDVFSLGNVYTRAHASISHNGQRWLGRHDRVTSVPHIGSDWFLVSDFWVNQDYPLGSIVQREVEGSVQHFRKVSDASALGAGNFVAPGTAQAAGIWEPIPPLSREDFDVPNWHLQEMWHRHDVVSYLGVHYVSLVDNNTDVPDASTNWQTFVAFDPANTVPWHHVGIGRPWRLGDFVRADIQGETRFFFHEPTGGLPQVPISPPWETWHSVLNWDDLTGVRQWNPLLQYSVPNTFVQYEGLIYRLTGSWAQMGLAPINALGFWERVLTWEEVSRPLAWTPGLAFTGPMLFYLNTSTGQDYYILINETWAGNTLNPTTDPRFRPVREFDINATYTALEALTWGTGIAHVYTIDEQTNERQFWQFRQMTGEATTISGEIPGESIFWQPFEFTIRENMLVTTVVGRLTVWDRAPSAIGNVNPGQPSVLNPNWIRRVTAVEDRFVYTIASNGLITLWRNTLASNTNIPGGFGWQQVDFPTGNTYVSTVNSAGIYNFWYSPIQSSMHPSLNLSSWQMLAYDRLMMIPDFFYMRNPVGQVIYFEVDLAGGWRHVDNAWIGGEEIAVITGGNRMIPHWSLENSFSVGDVVVYGITRTNTLRYFRLRSGADAAHATGIPPFSPAGHLFWEPIR